jgi:putative iron-only hydrogenase system regulator
MGIPYSKRGVNIISVVLDAPDHIISSLSGKLGRIPGISVKSMLAKTKA